LIPSPGTESEATGRIKAEVKEKGAVVDDNASLCSYRNDGGREAFYLQCHCELRVPFSQFQQI